MTQLELFEGIPIFGAFTGALLNLCVARKTEQTARSLCQERWLRDNCKVDVIEPAPEEGGITSIHGWSGAFARACCTAAYGVSLGACFPVFATMELFAPIARAFTPSKNGSTGAPANSLGIAS